MLEIHFHAVLQKMLLAAYYVCWKIKCFMSHGWIDIDAVTIVAKSVHYYAVDMLKDANATHQLHCQ